MFWVFVRIPCLSRHCEEVRLHPSDDALELPSFFFWRSSRSFLVEHVDRVIQCDCRMNVFIDLLVCHTELVPRTGVETGCIMECHSTGQ